jgi:hypothetical protein
VEDFGEPLYPPPSSCMTPQEETAGPADMNQDADGLEMEEVTLKE